MSSRFCWKPGGSGGKVLIQTGNWHAQKETTFGPYEHATYTQILLETTTLDLYSVRLHISGRTINGEEKPWWQLGRDDDFLSILSRFTGAEMGFLKLDNPVFLKI